VTGIGVLTGKVRNREAITGPGDSIAMDVALQLHARRLLADRGL